MDNQPFLQHIHQTQQFSIESRPHLSNFNQLGHLEGNNSCADLPPSTTKQNSQTFADDDDVFVLQWNTSNYKTVINQDFQLTPTQIQNENDEKNANCAGLTQQKKQLLENKQELNDQKEKQENVIANSEIIHLQSQAKRLNGELHLFSDESAGLQQKIGDHTFKKLAVEEKVNSLKDDNVNLRKKILHLMSEVDTFRIQKDKYKTDCCMLSKKLKRERDEAHQQKEDIEQFRSDIKKLELELSSERNKNTQLRLQLDGESERVRQANVLVSDRNNLIRSLTAELAEQKFQMLKEKNIKVKEKEAIISRQADRVELLEKQLKNLERDKEELQRKLEEAKKVEHEQNHDNEEIVQLNKKVHDLEMSNQKYKNENVNKQKIIERMYNENIVLNGKLRTKSKRVEELEDLLQNEKLKVKEAPDEISALKFQTSFLGKGVEENKEIAPKKKIEVENNEKHVAEFRMELAKFQSKNEWLGRGISDKTEEQDLFHEEPSAKKTRKTSQQHVQTQDDDDHDFLWKMIRERKK